MNFHVLTLFPEMIEQGLSTSITGRALEQNIIGLNTVNIRDFSVEKHGKVDDYTYGGGAGMLMQAEPVYRAYKSVEEKIPKNRTKRVIYVTPQGQTFTQQKAKELSGADDLIFLCGHYEGIDERVLEEVVTDYISIGDYVLTGGELAAMVMIDAIARLVPGVLHNEVSAETESFHGNLLEYPQYSRPAEWHGKKVPEVLLSGNQKNIDKWRLEKSLERTRERRPDLYMVYKDLADCKEKMLKQKLLHIDMIELINRGRAKMLFDDNGLIVLKDNDTGIYYYTDNFKTEQSVDSFFINDEDYLLVVHSEKTAEQFMQNESMELICSCYLSTYTKREKAPVTNLYRPDGKPLENGNAKGLCIRTLGIEHSELVMEAHPDLEEDYLEQQVKSGQMIGAFIDEILVGFAGLNDTGDIGLLYVYPNYRRKHIGKALLTYMVNQSLENGHIPYCMIEEGNESVIALQKDMGMYISKTPIFWLKYSN